jgi:hypothetical protein
VRSGLETNDEDIVLIPGYVEEHEWDLKRYGRQPHWCWCLANAFTSEAKAIGVEVVVVDDALNAARHFAAGGEQEGATLNKRGAAAGLTGWSRRMFERGCRRGRSS